MFYNGSFELGHYNKDGIPELQIPKGWNFWYKTSKNPISSDPWNQFVRPEVRVLPRNQLPENEQDLFILDGDYCIKIFKGYGAWDAAIQQGVTLERGVYAVRLNVYGDAVYYDGNNKNPAADPQTARVRVNINGISTKWQNLAQLFYNELLFPFNVLEDGNVKIAVEFMLAFAVQNAGIFADKWEIVKISDLPKPEPCPGRPREQYPRTYILLHLNDDRNNIHSCLRASYETGKAYTAGFSADDAGMGALDEKEVIAVNPQLWTGTASDLEKFFETYYPKTVYNSITESDPTILYNRIKDREFDSDVLPPEPFTILTYHQQNRVGGTENVLKTLHDAGIPLKWYKIAHVDMEFARTIKQISPSTKVVYRYVDNNIGHYHTGMKVGEFLDHFWQGVEDNQIDAVESLNETIATNDYDGIMRTVEFDTKFAEEVYRRSGGAVSPVVLTAAVGNPQHGEQERWMLPAVEAAVEYNGYLGPHAYFPITPNVDLSKKWMQEEGYHFHLRPLLSWDLEFGYLKPRYLIGETGGIGVYVNNENRPGGFISSGTGWKSPQGLGGDLNSYLALLIQYQNLVKAWNRQNGNRCEELSLFTTGYSIGWDGFLLNEYEWNKLLNVLLLSYSPSD